MLLFVLPAVVQAQFNYKTVGGTITITKYTGTGGAVTIPSTINNLPVTSIGTNAFASCVTLTSVTIPTSVTNIGDYAFYSCTSLTSVYDPQRHYYRGLCLLFVYQLDECYDRQRSDYHWDRRVRSLHQPDQRYDSQQRHHYWGYAFYSCISLTSVLIGNSVITIGDYAFYSCTSLPASRSPVP